MARLSTITPDQAQGKTKELYDQIKQSLGKVFNIFQGLGNSPTALKAYLQFDATMKEGLLSEEDRQVVYLASSEKRGCHYCVSAHTQMAKGAGIDEQETLDIRKFSPQKPDHRALTDFVKRVMEAEGFVEDSDIEAIRSAGYDDGQITEVIAMIAMSTFTNYFNHVYETQVDFPQAAKV